MKISELISLDKNNPFKVIAGDRGLDREFTVVFLFDSPEFYQFLNGGEFIITTGYIIKDNPLQLVDLIKKMDRAGTAALGVKFRHIDKLPREVIETANSLDFPIIIIPKEFDTRNILDITTSIINQQASQLKTHNEIHRVFSQLVISGGSVQDIMDKMASLLKCSIAFYDHHYQELFIAEKGEGFKGNLAKKGIAFLLDNYPSFPVKVKNTLYGHLIYQEIHENNNNLEFKQIIMEEAATVLILNIQKRISVNLVEMQHRDEFIFQIISEQIKSMEELEMRARLYGWKFDSPIIVLLMDLTNFKDIYVKFRDQRDLSVENVNLFRTIQKIMRDYLSEVFYCRYGEHLVYLINVDQNKEINKLIEKAISKINNSIKEYTGITLDIGVGSQKEAILEASDSYQEARVALEIGKRLNSNKGRITFYDQMGSFVLLAKIYDLEIARNFTDDILEKLLIYDQECESNLMTTLETLIRNGWNMKETARELYLHYNSIIYRVNRIKEILGMDLADPERRFTLSLAVKLKQLSIGNCH